MGSRNWNRPTRWVLGALLGVSLAGHPGDLPPPNQLSEAEKADGWRLLFDGESLNGWRLVGRDTPPTRGWVVEDGILKKQQGVRGGNLLTVETFWDFEFAWTWRLPTRGNNGVKFFVREDRGALGHEYQMLNERQAGTGKGSTGSFYDVLPPNPDRRPFRSDEWNHSRVVVHGDQVEHWLNGQLILEYELGSEAVLAAVANSKFRDAPGFGTKVRGHIMLTDHTDEAWFRDVKIRVIDTP